MSFSSNAAANSAVLTSFHSLHEVFVDPAKGPGGAGNGEGEGEGEMSATVNGPTWDQRAADETENEKTTEGSPLTAVPESPGSGESIQHTPIRGRSIHPPRVANIPICTSCAKKDSLIPLKQLPAPIIPLVVSARGNTKSKPTHICPPCLRALLSNRLRQLLEDDARETGEFNDAAMRNLGEWEEQEGGWQGRFETSRTFGERAADGVAARGGSWSFVLSLISILLVWCILNATLPAAVKWDEYPFILLNLFLSMLAAFQAPIIMMSQNRQAARDRAQSSFVSTMSLRAEHGIRQCNAKLDHVIHGGWKRLLEIQEVQMWLLDPAFAGGQVASSRLDTVREEKEGSGGLPPSLSHTPSILRFASLHGPLHNRLSLSPLPRPTTHVHLSLPLSQSSDAHLARLLATNSPVFEFTHRHSNGSNFRCTISEVRLKLRNGHLRGVEYTLSPTDPTASLDDLLSGDSTVTLRNDLSIPSQSHPHGRIARIEVIFASGQKEVWTNGRVPPRYKPSFAMKREERLVELWKKPVSSLRISYAPHAGQGLGTGAVIVGKGKTVHAMRAVFTLEDGEGCRLWARKAGDVESVLREVAEGRAGQSGWKLLFDHGLADRKPVSRSATKPGDIAISQSSLDSTNSNTSIPGTPSETLLLRDDDPGPGRTVAAELVPFPDEEAEGTWVLYGEGTGRVEIDGWVGERERSNEMENQTSYFG